MRITIIKKQLSKISKNAVIYLNQLLTRNFNTIFSYLKYQAKLNAKRTEKSIHIKYL